MKRRVVNIVKDMAETFVHNQVARSSAALSYYLTLSVFPMLISLSAILGILQINESVLMELLRDILPVEIYSTISDILSYIGGYSAQVILVIGLSAMLTSSSAAFRSFTGIMGEIQGERRYKGLWGGIFSFILSIAFLFAIYISGFVILSGEWLLQILERNLGFGNYFALWTWIRFVLLFLLLFGIIYGVYLLSAPKEIKRTHRLPGAFAASVVLVAASIIYSRMISASIKYALLYGSLASFVILMIWLYTCGLILIMGNVFNISLNKARANSG